MKLTKLTALLLILSTQTALADSDDTYYRGSTESLEDIRERQSLNDHTYYTPERIYTDEIRREINNDNINQIQQDNQAAHDRADVWRDYKIPY